MTNNSNTTEWASYRRHDFIFENRAATLVHPKFTASGRPWIWRTEYFGAFPQVDLALLERGWHLAYVNMSELYGGKECLGIMRRFQEHIENEYCFTELPVLLGFSRGGYSAFNYAICYPEKVALLYLDAPLLDLRCFAEMKNSGTPSEGFKKLLERFASLSSKAFDDVLLTPMDYTEKLVAAGIPVILVAGDADEVLPYEENAAVLVKKYRELGGDIELILKHGCKHHPHSLENPAPIIDFIMKKIERHG